MNKKIDIKMRFFFFYYQEIINKFWKMLWVKYYFLEISESLGYEKTWCLRWSTQYLYNYLLFTEYILDTNVGGLIFKP